MSEEKDICTGIVPNTIHQLNKLDKKLGNRKRTRIYPLTYIQAVYDAKSGTRLDALLNMCNSIYLPWRGTARATRIQVPYHFRRKGLMISYRNINNEIITEKCILEDCIKDDLFGLDQSWVRITDALPITGNVTIGNNGNWFVDGEDTGFKAQGPKGDNGLPLQPRLSEDKTKIEFSYNGIDWHELFPLSLITPTIDFVEPIALEPGATPTVENVGDDFNAILQVGLPKAPEVNIGSTTTIGEGNKAKVTNSGTKYAPILNFEFPKGDTGNGLKILGFYDTFENLNLKVTAPEISDTYCVGTAEPYHLYVWTNIYNPDTQETTPGWKDAGTMNKDTTIIVSDLGDREDVAVSQSSISKEIINFLSTQSLIYTTTKNGTNNELTFVKVCSVKPKEKLYYKISTKTGLTFQGTIGTQVFAKVRIVKSDGSEIWSRDYSSQYTSSLSISGILSGVIDSPDFGYLEIGGRWKDTETADIDIVSNSLEIELNKTGRITILPNDSTGKGKIPNIDSNNGIFDFGSASSIYIGDKKYTVNEESKVLNIKSGESSVNFLMYNTLDGNLRVYNGDLGALDAYDVVIGSFRTNYGSTYTSLFGIDLPFEYTLNGKKPVYENLYSDTFNPYIKERVIEKEVQGKNSEWISISDKDDIIHKGQTLNVQLTTDTGLTYPEGTSDISFISIRLQSIDSSNSQQIASFSSSQVEIEAGIVLNYTVTAKENSYIVYAGRFKDTETAKFKFIPVTLSEETLNVPISYIPSSVDGNALLPNLDTKTGIMDMVSGAIVIRGKSYSITEDNRTFSVKGGDSTIQAIYFNTITSLFSAKNFSAAKEYGDIFIGCARVNYGVTYSYFVSMNLPFNYRIDGGGNDAINIQSCTFNSGYNGTDIEIKSKEFCKLFNNSEEIDTFLFFTDPHLLGNNSVLTEREKRKLYSYVTTIQKYYNSLPFNFCLCGGDWLNNGDTKDAACWKLGYINGFMNNMFSNYYQMLGNHDTNYQGKEDEGSEANTGTLTEKTISNLWYRNTKKAYYSFTSPTSKVYILDSQIDWNSTMDEYKWEQIDWLGKSLETSDDKNIIIGIHIFYVSSTTKEIPPFTDNILQLLEAFNNKTTIRLNEVDYNFSEKSGKVHFVIAGHNHNDLISEERGIPVILTTNTQKEGPTFDMVYVDYTNRKISTIRVGYGENRMIFL